MANVKKRKSYSERSDIEKIRSNWIKVKGLYEREEWSGAIIRLAIASEIAVNLMIKEELVRKRHLDMKFVESLLRWANGIQGKIDRIILPLSTDRENPLVTRTIIKKLNSINNERKSIVHEGQFKKKSTAERTIRLTKEVIEYIVKQYKADFKLKDID